MEYKWSHVSISACTYLVRLSCVGLFSCFFVVELITNPTRRTFVMKREETERDACTENSRCDVLGLISVGPVIQSSGCRCCFGCCSHMKSSPNVQSVFAGQAPITLYLKNTLGKRGTSKYHKTEHPRQGDNERNQRPYAYCACCNRESSGVLSIWIFIYKTLGCNWHNGLYISICSRHQKTLGCNWHNGLYI